MSTPGTRDLNQAAAPSKAVAKALVILQILADSPEPLSATAIGRRVGLHQSSVSRILATFAAAGYVRKTGHSTFSLDFGVLALGAAAIRRFKLADKPRAALTEAADLAAGLVVSLSILWRREVIYFLRTEKGRTPILIHTEGFPLHLSSPGLRLALDLPEQEALSLLRTSRTTHGWERPTEKAPESEPAALQRARDLLQHDCIILDGWIKPGHMSAAINIDIPNEPPIALSFTGPTHAADPETIRLWLHMTRRSVELAMASA